MRFLNYSLAVTAALAPFSNAATINFYSDQDCQDLVGIRKVADNSCAASTGVYQSFKITSAGGNGQVLTSYSGTGCTETATICALTAQTFCVVAVTQDGSGSNSISSTQGCMGKI